MGRKRAEDPKMKNNMYIRQSFLCKIDELNYDLGISKTKILDLCIEHSLPMFKKLLEKMEDLKKPTK